LAITSVKILKDEGGQETARKGTRVEGPGSMYLKILSQNGRKCLKKVGKIKK